MKRPIDSFASQDDWQADFENHARWQMTAALAATPAQRLAWLEEMRRLALVSGALQRRLESEE